MGSVNIYFMLSIKRVFTDLYTPMMTFYVYKKSALGWRGLYMSQNCTTFCFKCSANIFGKEQEPPDIKSLFTFHVPGRRNTWLWFIFQENGLFIECGALDGETRSNSLFLEMQNDWRGILIEADPMSLAKIRYIPIQLWN